jgi:hypothetical protein
MRSTDIQCLHTLRTPTNLIVRREMTRATMITTVPCNLQLKMLPQLLAQQVILGIGVMDHKVRSTMNTDMIRFHPLRLSTSMVEEALHLDVEVLQMLRAINIRTTPSGMGLRILPLRSEIHLKQEILFPQGLLTIRCLIKANLKGGSPRIR